MVAPDSGGAVKAAAAVCGEAGGKCTATKYSEDRSKDRFVYIKYGSGPHARPVKKSFPSGG